MAEKIKQVKPEDLVGPLKTSSIIQRHPLNPIFTSENVPYPSVIAYNAGVVKYQRQYVMAFRTDYNWSEEQQKAIGFQIGVAYRMMALETGASTPNRSLKRRAAKM